jgi:RNA polymerase sigma factor (TIGR02999 family)
MTEEALEIERFARDVLATVDSNGAHRLEDLLPRVYDELRTLAAYVMRGERAAHTLRPTALAHEAYLRLARETRVRIIGQAHLLALAATAMRRVLIDHARARTAAKRGAGAERITLGESLFADGGDPIDLLVERLGTEDPRKVGVVELLYFAGLTYEEAAAALGVSVKTILRDWRYARAWLWRELSPP